MSPEVLERPAEDKLHWLENLIDTYEQMHGSGQNGVVAARTHFLVAELLVDEGIGMRQDFLRLWHFHWTSALAARSAAERRERGEIVLPLLERGESVIRRTAELARAYAVSACREVARLAQFEEQSRTFPVWVKECKAYWNLLMRPRPPLNRERIAEADAAYARGEGEAVEDIIARLESGGPLVKE